MVDGLRPAAPPAAETAEGDVPAKGGGDPVGARLPVGALGSGSWEEGTDVAGEPACMAHLICLSCGAVLSEGHQPGCSGP
jgi:hypothetical protein